LAAATSGSPSFHGSPRWRGLRDFKGTVSSQQFDDAPPIRHLQPGISRQRGDVRPQPIRICHRKIRLNDIKGHFRIKKRDHSIDVDNRLILGKQLIQGLNVGGGVSGRIPEECSAHAEKPANPLTDLPPPSVAVGHAARKVPRGDGQNSARVYERVLDGSFPDAWIVD
jgi:hypothetical protein